MRHLLFLISIMQPFKNLKEIAKSLDLSPATVSRVLNGKAEDGRISRETQDRVWAAVEARGVLRNAMARSLKISRTQTFGLLIPDISNPFFAAIAQSIVRSSRSHGYSVLLCDNEEDEAVEQRQLRILEERRVDGIIAAPVGNRCEHWLGLQSRGMPLCLVDRWFPDSQIPFVTSDNETGARLAILHLLEMGHRRIGILQGNPHTTTNTERLKGCRDTISSVSGGCETLLIAGEDFGEKSGYSAAMELLKMPARPTALFAFSNMICLGAMKAAAELNLKLPESLSMVAFDEQVHSAFMQPPLTTISQDRERIGSAAVEQLLAVLSGQRVAFETRIPTRLIPRASVKAVDGAS